MSIESLYFYRYGKLYGYNTPYKIHNYKPRNDSGLTYKYSKFYYCEDDEIIHCRREIIEVASL